ncbi:hypothetical protein D3C73_1572800 [compost metagenome]
MIASPIIPRISAIKLRIPEIIKRSPPPMIALCCSRFSIIASGDWSIKLVIIVAIRKKDVK